jgi:hypothetical protein
LADNDPTATDCALDETSTSTIFRNTQQRAHTELLLLLLMFAAAADACCFCCCC